MTRLRLAFMGTPDFAVPTLQALRAAGHDVVAVYSQPPRPAGRGQKPRPSPVAEAADAAGIPVYTPLSLKNAEDVAQFQSLNLDAAVVVAYGLILPKAILDAPRLGCVNVHASLLPRWRGAAPIHRAIMAGDAETGVTIMAMAEGLDTGPMILIGKTPIGDHDTTAMLHDRLAAMGAALIAPALAGLDDGSLTLIDQPADGVTYAKKIDKAEARIDWTAPAATVLRQIHGLSPFPGAWFTLDGVRIKLLNGELRDGQGQPGTVIDSSLVAACGGNSLVVACGDGEAIAATRLQREGKGPLAVTDFLRGCPIHPGTVLS